jgi:hypothetical protein
VVVSERTRSTPGGAEIWMPSAAVRSQHTGDTVFDLVDDHPGSEFGGFYRGFTTSFKLRAGKDCWFHFPITTPSMIAGVPLALARLSLLWETQDAAVIEWVTMHHGGQTRLELSPRQTPIQGELQASRQDPRWPAMAMRRTDWRIDPVLPVAMGIQLCIFVRAADAPGIVRFYGAGASFCPRSDA